MSDVVVEEIPLTSRAALDFVDRLLTELGSGEDAAKLDSEKLDRSRVENELKLAKNVNTAFLATIDGAAVGLVTVTECFALYAGGRYGVINQLYVDPACRSRAVGARLVEHVKQLGRLQGWQRIDVTAPPDRTFARTIAFYERQGFRFTGPKLKCVLKDSPGG